MRHRSPFVFALSVPLLLPCAALAQQGPGPGFDALRPDDRPLRLRAGTFTLGEARAVSAAAAELAGERRVVLQFDGAPTAQRRAALAGVGVRLGQYLTDGAFVASLDGVDPDALEALGFVRAVSAYREAWKLAPDIGVRPAQTARRAAMRIAGRAPVDVSFFADADPAEVDEAIDAISALPDAALTGRAVVGGNLVLGFEIDIADAPRIAELGAVQFVEESAEVTDRNTTARWIVQSAVQNQFPLYDNGLTGAGQVVGVMDSGFDQAHCSFAAVSGKVKATLNSPPVTSHGTHVAAIAAGDPGAGSSLRGHAYDAQLVLTRRPAHTFSDFYGLQTQIAAEGAFVHNNSWGDDSTNAYTGLARAVDAFSYDFEDHLVVFAASNSGQVRTPENAKNCLAVNALSNNVTVGEDGSCLTCDTFCSGGSGLTVDGRLKPEIFAPGCSVTSAAASTACGSSTLSGTSMAAPAVSGVAALVRQYFTDGYYPTGAPSPSDAITPSGALLKGVILNSATGVGGVPDGLTGFNGWGRVRADDPLYFDSGGTPDTRLLFVEDRRNAAGLSQGGAASHVVGVTDPGEALRVTLVWVDPPAAPGASFAPVNDLDLVVEGPGGTTYLGNVFVGGQSATGGSDDDINNVEQVWIDVPAAGDWTVTVLADQVNTLTQGYALVVTGGISAPTLGLSLSVVDPPALAAPGEQVVVEVEIDERDDALVPGSAMLRYRHNPAAPFQSVSLSPLGGTLYGATVPSATCGHALEIYAEAEGGLSGPVAFPGTAPAGAIAPVVGSIEEVTVFSESFDSAGVPPGFPAPTGLWQVTDSCGPTPPTPGGFWAAFARPGFCDYNTGATAVGDLATSAIQLPSLAPGESIVLRYDSYMENENASRFDQGHVEIAGAVLDEAPDTGGAWETREVDLTAYAGQSVSLVFNFDTIDSFANSFAGWRIDNLAVVHRTVACADPCPGDLNGDGWVTLPDLGIFAAKFGLQVIATRDDGDFTGDGDVALDDFGVFALQFGSQCP